MTSRRVVAAVVLGLALVAGACGDGSDGGSASGDLPLLPGSSATGDGGRSAGEASGATAALAEGDATAAPGADMAIAPYQPIEYRLAGSVPKLGGKAAAYRFEADVDEDAVAKLAKAVGVSGTVREEGDSWVVGAVAKGETRPDGRQLYVGPDGNWNMYDARAEAVMSESVATSCAPDGECTEASTPPPTLPPVDLISNDEAENKARELFDAAGVELDDTKVRVQREERAVMVSFEITIDDLELMGYGMSAAFGDKGALQFANGSLATPAKIGDYPLIDTTAAFDRSQAQGGGVGIAVDSGDGAVSSGAGSSGSSGSATAGVGAEPATDPVSEPEKAPEEDAPPPVEPEPMPPESVELEPMPPVETLPPKVVELKTARLVLIPEYGMCPGDPVYLVPAYFFGEADREGYGPVAAVADEYLASSRAEADDAAAAEEGADFEPCPGTLRGETEPGREPADSPTVTG